MTAERALIDLSLSVDLLTIGRYESLRKAIGEPVDSRRVDLPTWDAETSEIRLAGNVVREVSTQAKNIRLILDAFQELNWKARIDSPLPGDKSSRALRETIRNLNQHLSEIEFFCDGTGKGILWQHVD